MTRAVLVIISLLWASPSSAQFIALAMLKPNAVGAAGSTGAAMVSVLVRLLVAVVALLGGTTDLLAQDHLPLQVIRPMASNADPSLGLDPDARYFRQPSGVDYVIRAEVIGGEFPFSFTLSNEPAGMTIVTCLGPVSTAVRRTCGTITWVNPTSTATDVQVTVTDHDGDMASATWTIAVSALAPGAGGACYIDADTGNDSTGSGTEASPWQTLDKARDSCGARSLLFLKGNGPYNYDNIALFDSTSECYVTAGPNIIGEEIQFDEGTQPVIWIDYPEDGLTPIVDVGYTQGGTVKPCLQLSGQNVFVHGVKFTNCIYKCIETARTDEYGATYWRVEIDTTGIGFESANSAGIMYAQRYSQNETPYYDVVSQSTFRNIGTAMGGSGIIACIKNYSQRYSLVADNQFTDVHSTECLANKADVEHFTDRNNVFENLEGTAIGGNNHGPTLGGVQTRGEIAFNLVRDVTDYALEFNQDGQAGPFYVYRNTFNGQLHARAIDASDGPFTFVNNVIINSQAASGSCPAKFDCTSVTDYSRIVHTPCGSGTCDLTGVAADGILDANEDLQGSYLTSYGPDSMTPKGHMLGAAPASVYRLRLRLAWLLPNVWRISV